MASYYRGPGLNAQQVAQVFYQAGWRGRDLIQIVGIVSQRESKGPDGLAYAGAHRTDTNNYNAASGDLGLAQVNWGAWGQALKNAGIIDSHTDLYDPVTNARAAKYVYEHQGWAAWGSGAGGWQTGGNALYGVNIGAAEAAVQQATTSGLINQDWQSGGTTTGGGAGNADAARRGLPRDARIVQVPGVAKYAMFQVVPGLWIRYAINSDSNVDIAGLPVTRISQQEWKRTYGNSVNGGNAAELADIPTAFGSYKDYLDAILDQVFPAGDPRRHDAEVLRVLAERAGRPDMTEAEFENLLKGTRYYQDRTEQQLRWNDLSQAERSQQVRDMATRMVQSYLALVGRSVPTGNATIMDYAQRIASGQMTYGEWTETVVKPVAVRNAESPWSRQLRDEREAQRQRPMDIENAMLRVRDTLSQWGLKWSEKTMRNWATGIVNNTRSDDDLLRFIQKQAQVLYPWKDPEMETVVAAAPWIEAYNSTLERQGSLETDEIKKVLAAYGRDPDNNDPWSFTQRLKMSDAYSGTRAGQDEAWSTTDELAGMMGF
jgi:hypothetical protein